MVLPVSGNSISLDQIHVELGETSETTVALGDADVRALASDTDNEIGMDQFFGLSSNSSWIFTSTVDSSPSKRHQDNSEDNVWMTASRTGDGIYVTTTHHFYNGAESTDGGDDGEINIYKINSDGSVAWCKRIDGVDERIHTPTLCSTTTSSADDIFLWFRTIDGSTSGSSNRRRVLRFNSSGVEQNEREYATPNLQSEYYTYRPTTNKVYDDGTNIYIAGKSVGGRLTGGSAGSSGAFWTKIQKSDASFQAEFISSGYGGSNYGRGPVFVDGSGNHSLTKTDAQHAPRHMFCKYNSSNQKVFEKYYGYHSGGSHQPDTCEFRGGVVTGGQHIMACSLATSGETNISNDYHMSLLKLDPSDGSVTFWVRAIAAESDGFQLQDCAVDSSGNIYAVGWGKVGSDNKQSLWCGKFNSSGVKQWNVTLGLADDSVALNPQGIDVDNSGNVYFVGYINNVVGTFNADTTTYTQGIIMKVADGDAPTAGTTGIWKITNTDFAFASTPTASAYNNADSNLIGAPTQISDASASDVTLDNETGQSVTLVTV